MTPARVVTLAVLLVSGLVSVPTLAGQEPGQAVSAKTIDVGTARPVLRGVEVLRERYHLAITYEEPPYVYLGDLQDISYVHKGPVSPKVKLVAPRGGVIHFQYGEANGMPQEDITALIRRLVAQHAAQGGPVFDVQERSTASGPEWNVIALKARNESGEMVDQTDILGAPVSIPKARQSLSEFISEILRQVRAETGYEVQWATQAGRPGTWIDDFGADNVSARDALTGVLSRGPVPIVWDMNYDPESKHFFLTFIWTPQSPQNQ